MRRLHLVLGLLWSMLSALPIVVEAQVSDLPPPPPPPPSTSSSSITLDGTTDLTNALDRNVAAIANLTASNERTVDKLQDTVETMTASNDKNVAEIVRSADRLLPSLDALGDTTHDMLDAWEQSMKPSLDGMTSEVAGVQKLGRDALDKWDGSMKPSVDGIVSVGQDALKRWDDSLAPKVDQILGLGNSALGRVDDTIQLVRTTLLPAIIVAVTVWVAMCTAAGVACCILKKRKRHGSQLPGGKYDGYETIPAAGNAEKPLSSSLFKGISIMQRR